MGKAKTMMIDQLCHIARHGVGLARELFDTKLTTDQISELLKIDSTTAHNYFLTAQSLFAPINKAEKLIRDNALQQALNGELSLDELVLINQQVHKLASDVQYSREQLRLEMVQLACTRTFGALRTACRAKVRKLNIQSAKKPRSSVRISKTMDEYGMRTIVARLNTEVFHDFFTALEKRTASCYDRDSGLDYHHARAVALKQLFESTNNCGIGVHVVMRYSELTEGLSRDSYTLTDGSNATLKMLAEKLEPAGWAVVYDDDTNLPIEAAVIEQRSANKKQRQALIGHTTYCAAPGCHVPAQFGTQAHHIIPASMGGPTTISNLVLLCPFHHGQVTAGSAKVEITADGHYEWTCNYTKRRYINNNEVIEQAGHALITQRNREPVAVHGHLR
ncbi:HNH endonuclease signature motif containing protein [Corynebacterium kutscheri]|uniref:HNH endonuclease signature motif containing protein n=1 Tax=Corynebacterium kutscheri TaxID=35755 RepID=UPI0037C04D71